MSKLFRTTLWILSGIGLIAFLVQTLSTFLISPLMGLLSLLIAAVLVALVTYLLQRSPMWARPARLWALLAFLWGGGVAVSLALISAGPVMQLAIGTGWVDAMMSWSGAYPEESPRLPALSSCSCPSASSTARGMAGRWAQWWA